MVLIRCPACSKEISAEAKSCPGCGHPIRRKSITWARTKRIGAATLAIVLVVVQVAVQSAQGLLGILLLALGLVAVAVIIVTVVAAAARIPPIAEKRWA
ncbi:MAG: zinc-ribbon domain-containing protein [Gemmatimonadota bacterium]|nr:zinc-ribbon domain-containing protein [Gemmatimonadota bacterium]